MNLPMNDLQSQAAFVAQSAWRLLSQIDMDPVSPTRGCAHLAYWRDKTSDVADARRQEAMLPLALLYTRDYPGSAWRDDQRVRDAAEALLGYWCRAQYPDGSLDEWYKGERAFAAVAFTTYAVARTIQIMEGHLSPKVLGRARNALDRSACWLTTRNDLFKTNHQAVGVGALAFAGHVLDRPAFIKDAKRKIGSIVSAQTSEGWFPEVGRMDVGYTFLTVEYVTMAMDIWNDFSQLEPFSRAYDFACRFVHPDLTLGEEYGVCRNPYISRIATIMLSRSNPLAAGLRRRFETASTGEAGLRPTLADDLRLPRWSFQPLTALDYASRITPLPPESADELPLAAPAAGLRTFPLAGQAFLSAGGKAVIASASAGGLVRFFGHGGAELTEYGYCLTENIPATSVGYRPGAIPVADGSGVVMESVISPVRKFMPSFLARVALRLACSTALGSRLARKGIDFIRRRKGTALNQSSPSLAGNSKWRLKRTLEMRDGLLVLTDKLTFGAPVDSALLHVLRGENNDPMRLEPLASLVPGLPASLAEFVLVRTFDPGGTWRLVETGLSIG